MTNISYSIQQVEQGIFLLKMPLPFRLDHINLYLIDDVDGWVLVDTGLNTDKGRVLWQEFIDSDFFDKPIKKIILTHLHPDHIGMSAWLSESLEVPVYISKSDWEMANFLWNNDTSSHLEIYKKYWQSFGVPELLCDKITETRLHYRNLVKRLPKNVCFISEIDELIINKEVWKIIATPGHSPEHLCLWNSKHRLIICGDHVLPSITPNIGYHPVGLENPLESYLQSLGNLMGLNARVYLPAHGAVSFNFNERIQEIIFHHQKKFAILMNNMSEPITVHQAMCLLFPQELPIHQQMFAYAESAAHLIYLQRRHLISLKKEAFWIFFNEKLISPQLTSETSCPL